MTRQMRMTFSEETEPALFHLFRRVLVEGTSKAYDLLEAYVKHDLAQLEEWDGIHRVKVSPFGNIVLSADETVLTTEYTFAVAA